MGAGERARSRRQLSILVIHTLGSGKALELFQKQYRQLVIGNGLQVSVSKGRASFSGDTSSCPNPPTGDCTLGTFLAIKGSWVIEAYLVDHPPTIPGSKENETAQANDDPEDIAQEQAINPALSAIGQSIAAKV